MVAVLSPCNCDTTSYQDDKMHAGFTNPTAMLSDGRSSVIVDLNMVTAVQTYTLIDVQTL